MSELFVTSDTHYFHKNILKYTTRKFSTIEDHNEALIANWNSVVSKKDTVYHLGDFFFIREPELIIKTLKRLNGSIILINGNHDSRLVSFYKTLMNVYDYKRIKVNNKKVVLCHYPFEVWDCKHHGSYHLHGHIHSQNPMVLKKRRYDIGVDGSDTFSPYHIESLLDTIENRLDPNIDYTESHHV